MPIAIGVRVCHTNSMNKTNPFSAGAIITLVVVFGLPVMNAVFNAPISEAKRTEIVRECMDKFGSDAWYQCEKLADK